MLSLKKDKKEDKDQQGGKLSDFAQLSTGGGIKKEVLIKNPS